MDEALKALTVQVRMMTTELARHGFPGTDFTRLERMGLICRLRVVAVPSPELTGPMVTRAPTETGTPTGMGTTTETDWGAIAWRNEVRWTQQTARLLTVYVATARLLRLHGVKRKSLKGLQASHDLAVTSAFMQVRGTADGEGWVGEDALESSPINPKVPDAVVYRGRRAVKVIEVVGLGYDKYRLMRFHDACVRARIPYELW